MFELSGVSHIVVTGLVPVSPLKKAAYCHTKRDGRDKPGHDKSYPSTNPELPIHESRLAQIGEQRQQRQTENGEVVAFDALEQMHADAFELIGADAR